MPEPASLSIQGKMGPCAILRTAQFAVCVHADDRTPRVPPSRRRRTCITTVSVAPQPCDRIQRREPRRVWRPLDRLKRGRQTQALEPAFQLPCFVPHYPRERNIRPARYHARQRPSKTERPRRTARPGTRTLVDDLRADVGRHGSMWARRRSNCATRGTVGRG
jgi:hypothetical protein